MIHIIHQIIYFIISCNFLHLTLTVKLQNDNTLRMIVTVN